MKFTIKKDELLKVLKFSEKIVESKNISTPILNCINLIISKNQSKCICTNGIISGCYEIKDEFINIEEQGKFLIKNKILLEIVSKLEEEEISFNKIENSVLIIKTKSFSSQINIIDDSSFPNINFNFENLPYLEIKNSDLNEILKKNGSCVYNDPNQTKTISGIYFDTKINSGKITTLSTDTFKLAYLISDTSSDLETKFILNTSTLFVITQIIKQFDKTTTFYVDELNNKVLIKDGNITIIDRSIIGDYPVEIFIKAFNIEHKTILKIKKDNLVNGLEVNKVFVNLEKNPITTFEISNNQLELSAQSFEVGETKKIVEIEEMKGENLKIGFNISFLLTLLKNIDSQYISLFIEANTKPMLILGDNQNFKELILPVKINA